MMNIKISSSDAVAIFALIVAIWSLVQTIIFNKRQTEFEKTNERLNLMLIEKEAAEAIDQNRADISANFYKAGRNDWRLKVFNRGKAVATNVRLEVLDDSGLLMGEEIERKFPIPLMEPHSWVELIAPVHMESPSRAHIRLIWDDTTGKDRSKELHPTL